MIEKIQFFICFLFYEFACRFAPARFEVFMRAKMDEAIEQWVETHPEVKNET